MKLKTIATLRIALASLAASLPLLHAPSLMAQDYPRGQVKVIVPFTPGGGTDIMARLISQKLQELWSRPVIVDYRPGAGTVLGIDAVAKSPPDGLTIGIVVSSYTINPGLLKSMPYDTLKDLTGVTLLTRFALAFFADPKLSFDTIKGLVDFAKRNPGKLSFASPGIGGTPHLAGELLNIVAGIDLLHIPYKGSAPAAQDVVGGRVPLLGDPLFTDMPFVKAGRLKVIAVTSEKRVPGYEQYPTIAETYPGFDVVGYTGFVVPAATPLAIVRNIQAMSAKALAMPELRVRIVEMGNEPIGSAPEAFDAFIAGDIKKWAKVIADAKIPKE